MNPFWTNIFRGGGYEASLSYFLSTVPIFNKLSKRSLGLLESMVHERNYQNNEVVFAEGDIGSGMYAIRSGQVRIFIKDEYGNEIEQALLETGDFFGEVALTASRPRIASARTTEQTILVGLFRSDMLEAVRKHPSLSAKILLGLTRVISDRLHQSNLQLLNLEQQQRNQELPKT